MPRMSQMTPGKGSFDPPPPQRGCDPQVENCGLVFLTALTSAKVLSEGRACLYHL